jgi:hypothetical protein
MRRADVELWVLEVADRVKAGQLVEDARVELKSEWPAADSGAARQIAGLANAAQLEPVLVVIGLDQNTHSVQSAGQNELANWWPQVAKCFNGVAPTLEWSLAVPFGDVVLYALLFDTAAAPFVVREPNERPFNLVVPWREGTGTRAATRENLLRILVPATRAPSGTILKGVLEFTAPAEGRPFRHARLDLALYITTRSRDPVTFPHHMIGGYVRWPDATESAVSCERFHTPSTTILNSSTELVAQGPGSVKMLAYARGRDRCRSGGMRRSRGNL